MKLVSCLIGCNQICANNFVFTSSTILECGRIAIILSYNHNYHRLCNGKFIGLHFSFPLHVFSLFKQVHESRIVYDSGEEGKDGRKGAINYHAIVINCC